MTRGTGWWSGQGTEWHINLSEVLRRAGVHGEPGRGASRFPDNSREFSSEPKVPDFAAFRRRGLISLSAAGEKPRAAA